MTSIDGYRVGIVGSVTLVGKELVSVLRDRVFPVANLRLFSDDEEEEGTLAEGVLEPTFVKKTSREELENLDYVFFCGEPADVASWIAMRKDLGFVAIDMTQPSALVNEGEVRVAGVGEPSSAGDLIISAHPVATMLCLILDSLRGAGPIEFFSASVLQPASEKGQEGIDELFQQTLAVLNAQGPPREVFEQQVAFNVYSPGGVADLERFIMGQIHDVLGSGPAGTLLLQQGAIFHSHALSLHVRAREPFDEAGVRRVLEASEAIGMGDPDMFPGVTDAGGRDEIVIVRVSVDAEDAQGVWIQATADNLRRSSALNAVMLVEEASGRSGSGPN